MIVVDTNVVAYLLLEGRAETEDLLRADREWAAPVLWRSEFRSVLSRYRAVGRMELADALAIMELAEDLLQGREFQVVSADVLRLAADSGCSTYDCEFVALALSLGCPLATTDGAVLSAFPELARRP